MGQRVAMERRVLRHGKYRDRSFGHVENEDRDYCAWVLRALDLPPSLRLSACYLKNRHGGIMTVGRNKGKFFDEVSSRSWLLRLGNGARDGSFRQPPRAPVLFGGTQRFHGPL